MRQYETFEIRLSGDAPKGSQAAVDMEGVFRLNGKVTKVKGFYAGENTYIVRYLPEDTGLCTYKITGLMEAEGEEFCEPALPGRHGAVRAKGTHFQYADKTWFYPFGTTVYALWHQKKELMEETFQELEGQAFNKIRICLFPKHFDYNQNEPERFPFEKTEGKWELHRPCMEFWEQMEACIRRLDQMGIQCDLILFHPYDCWGFAKLGREDALTYLDYAVRRLSAFPNLWWSLANEYDLLDYEKEDWECFARFIHEQDSFGHLLSNHQIVTPWDFSNPDTTHICHQTGELEKVAEWIQYYKKPLMIDETGYEGDVPYAWGNLSAFELVNRFWTVCVQGGYCTHGETYLNEEEILWWSKGGRLVGKSPQRIRFLKELLDSLPGPLTYRGRIVCEDQFEELKAQIPEEQKSQPQIRLMLRSAWEKAKPILMAGNELEGCFGEEAYLKYYARHCTSVGTMKLPETEKYRIEVIDVWEMTRTQIMENASGEVSFKLPGKEGIAVLAVKL